jgi:hypothetical protein
VDATAILARRTGTPGGRVLAAGAPALADGHVYECQTFHIEGGACDAYDASGVTNCSGTPEVCTPLRGMVEGDGVAVANGLMYVCGGAEVGAPTHITEYDESTGAVGRKRASRSVLRAAHRRERDGLRPYAE